ncbi:MAG TPA: DUF177 domain-containing protein [Candidatus Sulfotelmatobacter sp.]|nr:DUF177 domain-containing protein [Candidatus Sulfotelmatobacter sp.]
MRINVADIKLEAGNHKTFPVQVAVEAVEMAGQDVVFDRPFTGEAVIWNAGDRLLVQASVAGEATIQCSRCLAPVTLPLEVSFEEEFIEGTPGEQEDELDSEAEDERNVTYFSGDEIDLSEPLRENILLELPMKPLCSDDCAGLCQTCGTNLNEGPCQCGEQTHAVDPRLAALKDLLRKPDTNS